MSTNVLIEARGVSKTYQTKDGPVESLKPLDFAIAEGEFVSVVGPSGCGKSTLLKMVAGLLPISGGELALAGKPIKGPQKDVGIVFQSAVLLPWRSVEDNILLQAEMRHLPKAAAKARARELMEMAGLKGFEGKYPWQLSGGMQQRASICRALLHDPSVLLMDEPFGALDAMTREFMNVELLRIWRESGKTIVFITHSIDEAVLLADRVAVMSPRPGRIERILEVGIPRPRGLAGRKHPRFLEAVDEVTQIFLARGVLHRADGPASS